MADPSLCTFMSDLQCCPYGTKPGQGYKNFHIMSKFVYMYMWMKSVKHSWEQKSHHSLQYSILKIFPIWATIYTQHKNFNTLQI